MHSEFLSLSTIVRGEDQLHPSRTRHNKVCCLVLQEKEQGEPSMQAMSHSNITVQSHCSDLSHDTLQQTLDTFNITAGVVKHLSILWEHAHFATGTCMSLASFPGLFKKSEKRTWYLLLAHFPNFLTFQEC